MNPTEHDNSARTFNLDALRADADRYGLRPEDLDALRDLRENPEEHARRVLYRAHYGDVRAHAADIMRDILSGSIASPEALEERLHEEADGSRSVFMYAGALRTVYASEEWDAGPEELGFADFASGVESVPELMTRAAYWALRADLRERLSLFVSHPPAPGSDEARELGFDSDSLDGLDLSDADTFPANRTERVDATEGERCECSEPGCSACSGGCTARATERLRRADLAGEPECAFCADCAADASASGVFGSVEEEGEPEEGPSPEDYVVSSNGFRLSVSIVEGEHVGDFAEHEEAEQGIREHRARTSPEFYPEVWSVSDHGNVSRYSEDGFAWDVEPEDPFVDFDRGSAEDACARTAFVLAWVDAEERAGRTYPGADLDDVAPEYVPGRFRAWARDVFAGAIGATTRGDGIAPHWAKAKPETLGRALALSCGGWTDGLGEADLPHPIGLPSMDADGRLWVEPSEFRTDPPSAEHLRALAGDRATLRAVEALETALGWSPTLRARDSQGLADRIESARCAALAPSFGHAPQGRAVREAFDALDSIRSTTGPASIAERIGRAISEDDPEDVLALADELLGGSGVESLDLPAPDEHERAGTVRYVNRGDTYTATLCYVEDCYSRRGRFVAAAWGSLLEQAEEERTYATGETRCAHCGDWGCEEHESE